MIDNSSQSIIIVLCVWDWKSQDKMSFKRLETLLNCLRSSNSMVHSESVATSSSIMVRAQTIDLCQCNRQNYYRFVSMNICSEIVKNYKHFKYFKRTFQRELIVKNINCILHHLQKALNESITSHCYIKTTLYHLLEGSKYRSD